MKLTLAGVKAEGLKALNENRLQFQLMMDGRIPKNRLKCYYRIEDHPECGCVIGVSIPPVIAKKIDGSADDTSAATLFRKGSFTCDSTDEQEAIEHLQTLHDCIVSGINANDWLFEIEAHIAALREALQP